MRNYPLQTLSQFGLLKDDARRSKNVQEQMVRRLATVVERLLRIPRSDHTRIPLAAIWPLPPPPTTNEMSASYSLSLSSFHARSGAAVHTRRYRILMLPSRSERIVLKRRLHALATFQMSYEEMASSSSFFVGMTWAFTAV
jgi:hypothetical protein